MHDNTNLTGPKKLSMLGCIGEDTYGKKILNSFNFFNINTELLEKVEMNTSKCAVGIYKHERYFLSQMSASKHLSDNFVRNNWNKIISHDALLVEGYFLAENFNLAYNICKEFSDNGKYIILTLSDPNIIRQNREQVITIANMADMIVGNINEAKNLIQEEKEIKLYEIDKLFNRIYALLNIIKQEYS